MYADDVSNIPSGGCNYYNGTTIQHYSDNHNRTTYALNGRKWLEISRDYSQYGYNMPSVCVDISDLHSNGELEPVFDIIAFSLALFVFFFAFKLFKPLFGGRYV